MSPGLLRARAPFRLQNALTGLVLAGFATAVWAYSIRAVKQDDFSDVDDEAREMMRGKQTEGGVGVGVGVGGDGHGDMDVLGASVSRERTSPSDSASALALASTPDSDSNSTQADILARSPSRSPPRGVLAPILDRAFPHLLDPTRKTLVWGAPPVNDLGRMRLRGSTEERR